MAFLQAELPWLTVAVTNANKTVAGFKTPTNQVVKVLEVLCSHDGNTSGNTPDITDLARCTFGNNAPGTNSTTVTLGKKDPGRAESVQTSGATTWTTEPTTVTPFRSFNLPQYNGLYHHILPFAAPLIVVGGQGFVVRQNSPNAVNSSGHMEFEE
jgi:hypothetical protein